MLCDYSRFLWSRAVDLFGFLLGNPLCILYRSPCWFCIFCEASFVQKIANGLIPENAQPRLLLALHTRRTLATLAVVLKQNTAPATAAAAAVWGPWSNDASTVWWDAGTPSIPTAGWAQVCRRYVCVGNSVGNATLIPNNQSLFQEIPISQVFLMGTHMKSWNHWSLGIFLLFF